jgi:uncharacterized phage protein (TIGR01671 family)
MREIKFRGKELGTGQWVYGNLVKLADGQVCIIPQNIIGDSIPQYSVDPKTVGQYTGLQDRNGKDIYEGDMIFHYDQNCIIEYDSSAFVLKGLHKDKYKRVYAHLMHYLIDVTIPEVDGSKYDGVTTKLEVIGNRFDNPELLGEVRE